VHDIHMILWSEFSWNFTELLFKTRYV